MARQRYIDKKFNAPTLRLIDVVDEIIGSYMARDFVLTVRQLYYQTIARDLLPDSWIDPAYNRRHGLPDDTKNTQKNYKRLASLLNDARLAGLLDWSGIEDRMREFKARQRWTSGSQIMHAAATSYHEDMWANQAHRLFVIVEKDALVNVLEGVCREFDVPLLAARGYPSVSVLRAFAQSDLLPTINCGQTPAILHLGDHDPSGIDMTRDLHERLSIFSHGEPIEFTRIALSMKQVKELNPPENPAKTTDSRFAEYQRLYGDSSWELDALSPEYLADLVRSHVEQFIDPDRWTESAAAIDAVKEKLQQVAEEF